MAQEYLILDIVIWFGLYLIVCISLNVEYGFGGIPNFGRALAVLIGAITVGGIVNRILMATFGVSGGIVEASGLVKSVTNEIIAANPAIGIGILVASLLLAALLGAITGALFILPSAKLSEDYLAITLLAISEVMFMVSYYNTDMIGGYYGVSVPNVLAFVPGEQRLSIFALIILLIAFLAYLLVDRVTNSPYGRLLRAIRENEMVAEAYGKNVMVVRIKTVAFGSAIAALAGALYAYYSVNVIASSFSRVEWTFYPFLMILLGGLANNKGVIAGVLAFVTVKVLLMVYKFEITAALHLPFEAVWLEYIMFGILMLIILIYKPEGLIKEKPIMTDPIKRLVDKIKKAK
ncbi:MAG: branched-chain amino acid ABC transporter permease [Archaeoglobaceae archaeon]|nr:branched-chain amino acid ABC transporter permease [Archaeoglobaceae archaeon]